MKNYPSIPKFNRDSLSLYTFDKLDGNNIRFEWSKKRGWYKFGTRTRLFDETDDLFGGAIPLFMETLAEPLEKIFIDNKWNANITVFSEYFGENSFAGVHIKDEPMQLKIIDVNIYKKGFLIPKEFLKYFEEYAPTFIGNIKWNKEFVQDVWEDNIKGVTYEGVVGKYRKGNRLYMYKTKTQKWIDKIKALYDEETAKRLINS